MTRGSLFFRSGSPPYPGVPISGDMVTACSSDKPQEDRNEAAQNFPPIYFERFARAAG
jgi:hypothetical protein